MNNANMIKIVMMPARHKNLEFPRINGQIAKMEPVNVGNPFGQNIKPKTMIQLIKLVMSEKLMPAIGKRMCTLDGDL
jgi:hypothetical protein